MTDLPPGWEWTTLGEVCGKLQYGWTSKASQSPNGLRMLRTTDITQEHLDWTQVPSCLEEPEDRERYRLHPGDIVVSRAGSVGVSRLLDSVPVESVFASYLIRLRPIEIDPHFLATFLRSRSYWDQIQSISAGIGMANINAKNLTNIRLPLPPSAEQGRIVAAVREYGDRHTQARQHLSTANQKLVKMRSSVTRQIEEMSRDSPESEFRSLVDSLDSKRVPLKRADRDKRSGPYRYFGAQGVIDTIDDYIFDGEHLLVAEDGANLVSRVKPIASVESGKFWVNNHAHVYRARPGVSLAYIALMLNANTLEGRVTGTAQPKLTAKAINGLKLPLPSLDRQLDLVHESAEMELTVDRLKELTCGLISKAAKFDRSVLEAALEGRLVAQDPTEEPASRLLRRVRNERTVAFAARPVRSRPRRSARTEDDPNRHGVQG